jgi:hypothetical protein
MFVFLLMCAIVFVIYSYLVAALLVPGLHLCAFPGPGFVATGGETFHLVVFSR